MYVRMKVLRLCKRKYIHKLDFAVKHVQLVIYKIPIYEYFIIDEVTQCTSIQLFFQIPELLINQFCAITLCAIMRFIIICQPLSIFVLITIILEFPSPNKNCCQPLRAIVAMILKNMFTKNIFACKW